VDVAVDDCFCNGDTCAYSPASTCWGYDFTPWYIIVGGLVLTGLVLAIIILLSTTVEDRDSA